MVYIYKSNNIVSYTRNKLPKTDKYITLERMIPKPVKDGFKAVLKADFDTDKVWYELMELPKSINEIKNSKLKEIEKYDTSLDVNSFFLNDKLIWLDKATRVGLMNSCSIQKSFGETTTTLWFGGEYYTLPIDTAIGMLALLEMYALQCYNVTELHKINVQNLTNKEEIESYDFKKDYPKKLIFDSTL